MKPLKQFVFIVVLAVAVAASVVVLVLGQINPNFFIPAFIVQLVIAILTMIAGYLLNPLIPNLQIWLFNLAQFIIRKFQRDAEESADTGGRGPAATNLLDKGIESLGSLKPIGAELWVVASGKGGVGKSLISLGLVEDLTRRKDVLLLDFDLHNCGLTSLLNLRKSNSLVSAYSLLNEFRQMVAGHPGNPDIVYRDLLGATYQLPEDFKTEHFNTIIEKFERDCRLNPEIWDNLHRHRILNPDLIPLTHERREIPINEEGEVSLYPPNAFVLPSRVGNEQMLLTEVSTSSYVVVFLFLRALCYWLRSKVRVVVLDLHGAHDMFTAGAILAAQKLVLVTTTDPGSWDGTLDLLTAINRRRDLQVDPIASQTAPVDPAVVFNSCHAWDERLPFVITNAAQAVGPRVIVKIAENDQVREMMKRYKFGQISKHRQLWASIREITKCLSVGNEKDAGAPEPEIRSIEAEESNSSSVEDDPTNPPET